MIGIGTDGEESVDPTMLSLTRNCGGGAWPLMDISSIVLSSDTPSAESRVPVMLPSLNCWPVKIILILIIMC
jgi:hypothetical protein